MLLFDLTKTAIAGSDCPARPPNDAELLAVTVALLSYSNRSFSDLLTGTVELTDRNRRRVAELIEERTPTLAREFVTPVQLRDRLKQLVGLQIFRQAQP